MKQTRTTSTLTTPSLLSRDRYQLFARYKQYLLEAIILPNKVVDIILIIAVLMATPQNQERTINVIFSAPLLTPIRAEDPFFFTTCFSSQWWRRDFARLKIDDCTTSTPSSTAPYCKLIVTCKIRRFLCCFF